MAYQQSYLTNKQQQTLTKHLKFYQSLDHGTRFPDTPAQKHFVSVCRGQSQIKTEHEYIYIKYRNRIEIVAKENSALLAKVNQERQSQYKSSKHVKKSITDKDWKKSEKENISRIISRSKKISNAMVTFSD